MDFSEQMIDRAPRHERIDYVMHDINSPSPPPPIVSATIFDHFIIGRAIHWIDRDSLGRLVQSNLGGGS